MCLQGFQGYGYSEDFTKNMTRINLARKSDNTSICLTDSPDDICKSCPNLKNNICENELQNNKIVKMDNEVLKKIDKVQEYNSKDLFDEISQIFNTKESVTKICFNCMWHEKCLFYQNLSDNR